ncbi:MAG: M24 family metallopeptidase, partial [Candidatus Hodarchaeota archaeon]
MKNQRKLQLKALLKAKEIDFLVLIVGANLYYLTGLRAKLHERPTMLFISTQSKDMVLLPALDIPNASSFLTEEYIYYSYTDNEGPEKALKTLIEESDLDGKKIGIEFLNMRVMEYELLKKNAPHLSFVNGAPIIMELRMIKDEKELSYLRKAADITEKALEATLKVIHPGITEQEVLRELEIQMLSFGSGELWKNQIVVSGPRTAFPHAKASNRVIESGDLLMIDTGATYEGYPCDLTRTFSLNNIDEKFKEVYDIVKQANEAVINLPNKTFTAEELDRVVRNVIKDHGYGEFFIHRTGHGIGLEGTEPPDILEGNRMEMKPGMTFTIEPAIYLPNKGGVRIEDEVVVTDNGLEYLTNYS